MTLRDLHYVVRHAPPLAPEDSVAKAIRLMRVRGLPALPVAREKHLIGLVHEEDLVALAAAAADPRAAAASVRVAQVARPIGLVAGDRQDLAVVAEALSREGASSAPVIAEGGGYLGMVLRRDLVAALVGEPPTPPIAGLATPFGVHLTTGGLRAGASDLALAATGVTLMVIQLLSAGVIYGLLAAGGRLLSVPVLAHGGLPEALGLGGTLAISAAQMVIFLALLRFSPLTGVHAAEHMVVHAIEEGEDLTLEKVKAMPRVHPRCGTNLMALLILLLIGEQFLYSMNGGVDEATRVLALFALVVIVLLTWRRLGAGLQRWVTTRQPSERQLGNAIHVGGALLAKLRREPSARAGWARRVWRSGFLQVVAGFVLVALVVEYGGPALLAAWSRLTG